MNMGVLVILQPVFPGQNTSCSLLQESLSLLSYSKILQIEKDGDCGTQFCPLVIYNGALLPDTLLCRSILRKTQVVTSNRQGLDKVPFVDLVKVLSKVFILLWDLLVQKACGISYFWSF